MLKMLKSRLVHAVRLVQSKIKDLTTKRSSKWPKVEHEWLVSHPDCAACGGQEKLNVHHKEPFHLKPALELDKKNFITLCMAINKHCHLLIGHGGDFKAYNPQVESDAEWVLKHPEDFKKVAAAAKADRAYD